MPRGLRDLEPEEAERHQWVIEKILEVFKRYGFLPLQPSTLENLETLEAKSGPEIKDQIYWFKDKAQRNLGLRFDLTVGLTRIVANRSDLPEPIKVFSIGGVWRYEEPQFARYRYHTQWDAEVYGVAEPTADAEIIALSADILESLGLTEHEFRISSRRLIQAMLRDQGVAEKRELEESIRIIDKLARIGEEKVAAELRHAGLKENQVKSLLSFSRHRGKPGQVLEEIKELIPREKEAELGIQQLRDLATSLRSLGIIERCTYDMSLVRGIGYYDGIVFEAHDRGGEDIGAILGGGRFDGLCRIYGRRDMPATGVAGGIERLLISLQRNKAIPNIRYGTQVFVAAVNDTVRMKATEIAQQLREEGVSTDYDLKLRPLQKQLEFARASGASHVVIVGPRELEKGHVKLRNMKIGSEEDVETIGLARRLRTLLA